MSGRIYRNIIEVRQGDSFNILLEFRHCSKEADLHKAELLMQVRDKDGGLVFSCVGESVEAQKGKMILRLTPEMTAAEEGDYFCDIQLTTDDGSINTIFPANVNQVGTFRITKQITK